MPGFMNPDLRPTAGSEIAGRGAILRALRTCGRVGRRVVATPNTQNRSVISIFIIYVFSFFELIVERHISPVYRVVSYCERATHTGALPLPREPLHRPITAIPGRLHGVQPPSCRPTPTLAGPLHGCHRSLPSQRCRSSRLFKHASLHASYCRPLYHALESLLLNHYSNVAVSFSPFRILVYVRIRIHCSFLCLLFDTV